VRYNLGTCLGAINRALVSFPIGRHGNEIMWDIRKAGCSREHMSTMADASDRMIVEQLLDFYDLEVAPRLPHLHQSVLHSGVKDWNAL
jgi:Ser/Thr protein kinase RdoA (MazF antagonist)